MSAGKFQRLGNRVNVVIFYGDSYTYGKSKGGWKVDVKFIDNGTKIEFEETHLVLETALDNSYERLDKIVSLGLGSSAMLPAIEHQSKSIDEEIPF